MVTEAKPDCLCYVPRIDVCVKKHFPDGCYYKQLAKQDKTVRLDAYACLGIDPMNPNPDGSDFHLMNAIDTMLK
jgi:hypothetical protein